MKARLFLLLVAVGLVALGLWSMSRRGTRHAPTPKNATAKKPSEVAIQDGKTLDFSTGNVVVKDSPTDRAVLQKSISEMDAAAGNVTFAPPSALPAAKK